MKKEFVMRGRTDSGSTETLNFSGHKKGYAYRLVEFVLSPSETNTAYELNGTITAGKTSVNVNNNIDFRNEGLIGSCFLAYNNNNLSPSRVSVVNDTFMVTQNLILTVVDNANSNPINWQCKFESVKMSGPEEAVTNYKQFLISDD
tara:strand:- start:83 stop:520 length:438 start_codon:yes stop_codon:yes gene_type:complete